MINIEPALRLRPARNGDLNTFFHWRNLPWVVALGASQRPVSWEEHHRWFAETIAGQQRLLLVIEHNQQPAGMIRYDLVTATMAEISLYLMPDLTGQGLGKQVLLKSIPLLLTWQPVEQLTARVLTSNQRSFQFFRSLRFIPSSQQCFADPQVLSLQLHEIPHSRPFIGMREIKAVTAVIASGHLAQGAIARLLEQLWANTTTMAHVACVGSGLGALRLALLSLGIGPGDEVIVPAYSCVALLNAVLALGATPVLADVLEDHWTIAVNDVRQRLTTRTRAIIAVHLFGTPASIPELQSLGLPVIEDCAHGIGGLCAEQPFGASGTLSISSFYATKMLAAGEGGIVATQDATLIEHIRQARDYGDQLPNPHHLNDKMTDIEAALALEQLRQLPEILLRRAERARRYDALLSPLAKQGLIRLPHHDKGRIWYRYPVRLLQHRADSVCTWMARRRVRVERPVWDLRQSEWWTSGLANTSTAFDRVISLPLYPNLGEIEQHLVSQTLLVCLEEGL